VTYRRRIQIVVLCLAAILAVLSGLGSRHARAAVPEPVDGYTVAPVSAGGTISGKILYGGKPIRPKGFPVTQDVSVCGKSKEVYPVIVEGGGVAEAVMWLDDINTGKAFHFSTPLMDQKTCEFAPHVLVMQPGTLKVTSSDPASHNIHIFPTANREVNQVMPPQGSALEITLSRPDQVKVVCEIHKWMSAYVIVAKNPYYVLSGSGGAYELGDVPPGKYHAKVWQESLGTQTQEVTVETGKTATLNFNLGSK
jgi:plastocyanin